MLKQCIIPKIHNLCNKFCAQVLWERILYEKHWIFWTLLWFSSTKLFHTPLMFKNSPNIWNELTEHQNYICYNSFWKHLSDDGILATFQKQQKCNAFHLECWYLLRKVFSGKTKYLTNNLHLRGVKRRCI